MSDDAFLAVGIVALAAGRNSGHPLGVDKADDERGRDTPDRALLDDKLDECAKAQSSTSSNET